MPKIVAPLTWEKKFKAIMQLNMVHDILPLIGSEIFLNMKEAIRYIIDKMTIHPPKLLRTLANKKEARRNAII